MLKAENERGGGGGGGGGEGEKQTGWGRGKREGGRWVGYDYSGWVEREIGSRGMGGLKENKIK